MCSVVSHSFCCLAIAPFDEATGVACAASVERSRLLSGMNSLKLNDMSTLKQGLGVNVTRARGRSTADYKMPSNMLT